MQTTKRFLGVTVTTDPPLEEWEWTFVRLMILAQWGCFVSIALSVLANTALIALVIAYTTGLTGAGK